MSHTLVLFHFGRKANLVNELLDWVLDGTSVLHISDDPLLFPGATPNGLAAMAVSWIQGCAVQALVAPDQFDTDDSRLGREGLWALLTGTGRCAVMAAAGDRARFSYDDAISGFAVYIPRLSSLQTLEITA